MVQGRNFVTALMVGTASISMIVAGTTVPAAAQAATGNYKIDSQPLGQALMQLSRQANVDIVASAKVTRGRTGKAVAAESVDAALRQMLSGSGLTFERAGSRYVIKAVKGGNAAAPTSAPTSAPERVPASQRQGRGTITGTVRDQVSGASLKGALVELVGTGRSTSTDDLGEFRFVNAPEGNVTVRISYLGYAEQQSTIAVGAGETYAEEFTLVGGSGAQEIVVYGSRSARAQALNQERTSENMSTVISGDLLGDFTGTTLSESLRRAPAVVFERNAVTGDGSNIAIRGLAPDLNTVKFNGIDLPEGSGKGRSASLSNILTESISKVTISKTLLPNQDSSGTGGLVEIETKTPLDRPKTYASLTIEGATKGNSFNDEFLAAGTVSKRFGASGQFGISASLQYRDRSIKRVGYGANYRFGQYLPLQVDGSPSISSSLEIDPRSFFPFDEGGDSVYPDKFVLTRDETNTSNLGLTLSAAWEVSANTKIFFDYQKLNQKDGSLFLGTTLLPEMQYVLRPIQGLGGEERQSLDWLAQIVTINPTYTLNDSRNNTDLFSFRSETSLGKFDFKFLAGYSTGKTKSRNRTLIGGAEGEFGQFVVLGPSPVQPGMHLDPAAFDQVEGRYISPFPRRQPGDDSFYLPLLTEEGFAFINDSSTYGLQNFYDIETSGVNNRYNAEGSGRWNVDSGIIKYVEVGGSFKRAKFKDATLRSTTFFPRGMVNLQDLGLAFDTPSLSDVGLDSRISLVSGDSYRDFLSVVPSFVGTQLNPMDFTPDARTFEEFTKEQELSAYLQTNLSIGKLEVIGGFRFSQIKIDTLNLTGPRIYGVNNQEDLDFRNANLGLVADSAKQTEFLPRILANYRFNANLVLRAGYFLSVARPQIALLSSTPFIQLQQNRLVTPAGLPVLDVQKGNPDLKSARTNNFDVSAEYYDENVGVVKLSGFYKRISNLLETNVTSGAGALEDVAGILPDDPRFQDVVANPNNYLVRVRLPGSNPDVATIWGIEAAIEKQFTFLPGFLSGLGIYANYTYSKSSKNQPIIWNYSPVLDAGGNVIRLESTTVTVPNVPFNGQARHSGTASLTYNKYGLDASLAYTFQARRQTTFQPNNLSNFEEAYGTLDARAEYRFKLGGGDFSVYAEGLDLLRGPHDPSLVTTVGADDGVTGKYYDSARYFGGRQVRVGLRASF